MNWFSGNWVDLVIIGALLFYTLDRAGRGFIFELIDLAGFVFSLIIGLRSYSVASSFLRTHFSLSVGVANTLGFLLLSTFGEVLFSVGANYFLRFLPNKYLRSKLNKSLGFAPALASALVLTAFLLTTILSLPTRPDIKQSIVDSKIGGYLTERTTGLEHSLSDIFGGTVQETLNFLTVKPESGESINLNFKTSNVSPDLSSENKMLALVNEERANAGLARLVSNSALKDIARAHCRDMFVRGYFSHYTPEGLSPFDRMKAAGIDFRAAGENLAYAPTVEIAHRGLMNSPGHRANILSADFGHVGIGTIDGGIYGRMFCQEFTN